MAVILKRDYSLSGVQSDQDSDHIQQFRDDSDVNKKN